LRDRAAPIAQHRGDPDTNGDGPALALDEAFADRGDALDDRLWIARVSGCFFVHDVGPRDLVREQRRAQVGSAEIDTDVMTHVFLNFATSASIEALMASSLSCDVASTRMTSAG